MKGTVTSYDATRAVATLKLENGEEATMHAAAFLDPKLPAVGDEIQGVVTSATNWVTVARRVKYRPALPTIKDDKGATLLRIKEGQYLIEIAHCVHCAGLVLAPQTDTCDCGAELYPVTKMVPLGVSLRIDQLKGR